MFLDRKMTLIFDLDETLVHCEHNEMTSYEHIVTIDAPSGEKVDVRITINWINSNNVLDLD